MDTNKIIQSWLRFVDPLVFQSKSVVVLGCDSELVLTEFQRKYPHIAVIIVDPRREKIQQFQSCGVSTFQYVSTWDGIAFLQKTLQVTDYPVPIISYRPCWGSYAVFFTEAERTLKGFHELDVWKNTPADFILDSLFA